LKPVRPVTALLVACAWAAPASAHPHVFAETRTEVVGRDGKLAALRHVWRFDEFFSATVLLEFDKDADGRLNAEETASVEDTIKRSTAEFNFFQNVYDNGREVGMTVPGKMNVAFEGQQLLLIFESTPGREIALAGNLTFGIFDPTFYTALDFINDSDLSAQGFPSSCTLKIVRPDAEAAIAENQGSLTEQFFDPADPVDYSQLFATRLEAAC
jgi:ABC-type uncharacterized transport system substrate-binding protein